MRSNLQKSMLAVFAMAVATLFVGTLAMAAPYYMAFAAVYAPLVRRFGAAAPLLAGAAWAGADLLRGRLLNGTPIYVGNSPWATFGYTQSGVGALVQIASVTGVYGISFTLACANAAIAGAIGDFARQRRVGRQAARGLAAPRVVRAQLGPRAWAAPEAQPDPPPREEREDAAAQGAPWALAESAGAGSALVSPSEVSVSQERERRAAAEEAERQRAPVV